GPGTGPDGAWLTLKLAPREPFDGRALLDFLEARAVPGVERVTGSTYARTIRAPGGPGLIELTLPKTAAPDACPGPGHVLLRTRLPRLRGVGPVVSRRRPPPPGLGGGRPRGAGAPARAAPARGRGGGGGGGGGRRPPPPARPRPPRAARARDLRRLRACRARGAGPAGVGARRPHARRPAGEPVRHPAGNGGGLAGGVGPPARRPGGRRPVPAPPPHRPAGGAARAGRRPRRRPTRAG